MCIPLMFIQVQYHTYTVPKSSEKKFFYAGLELPFLTH